MSYTFTEVDTFPIDETFDSLYADSLEDINSGTIVFTDETDDEKKQIIISLLNEQNYSSMKNIIIAKMKHLVCIFMANLQTTHIHG